MFQVLLVDDEAAVTNSLQYGINWDALDLKVAAVATSGREALNYIQSHPVDIVITDIRMADMDGLSLSQQISKMGCNIQIIIVSGFAEFSYAQKALSYGVIGYCLKPIEYAELTRYLHQAICRLGQSSTFSLCDDLLDAIQQSNSAEIETYLGRLHFFADEYYTAASVSKTPLFAASSTMLPLKIGHKRYLYISTLAFTAQRVAAVVNNADCIGFSYSTAPAAVSDLGSTLKRQSNSAFHYFFKPDQKLFVDFKSAPPSVPIHDLAKRIISGDAKAMVQLLHTIRDVSPDTLSVRYAWHLYNAFSSSERYGSLIAIDDIYSPEHLIFRFESFQNMIDTICSRLNEFPAGSDTERISNTAFFSMLKYINAHLADDCSLQLLAKEMNMNANYLGQIFKRETGKTYTAYVTELRIERAKQLLQEEELSISDIAVSLGFNDYFYFLKTFKRVTGVTPKHFRQGASSV